MSKTILKNKSGAVFCALVFSLSGFTTSAQISIDNMAPAAAYERGILADGQGGLASDLWQGQSAQSARLLLEKTKPFPRGAARQMLKSVLYSGGVPPQAKTGADYKAWQAERLHAVLKLGDIKAFDEIARQNMITKDEPAFAKIFTRRYLLAAQPLKACEIGDKNTIGRAENYWVKLRAFCHALRGEMAAAETTADILARSLKQAGKKDKDYFALLNAIGGIKTDTASIKPDTALKIAMLGELLKKQEIKAENLPPILAANLALDEQAEPEARLAAMVKSASILTPEQIGQVLGGLVKNPADKIDEGQLSAAKWQAKTWALVWNNINASRDMPELAGLAVAMLKQAKKRGIFTETAAALASVTAFIPAEEQAKYPEIFARIYVENGDLARLRALYLSLKENDKWRGRIALASDALGGGFAFGELGTDIETRLKDKASRARAVRDVYLAVALGAKLSASAEEVLLTREPKGRQINPGAMLALGQAFAGRAKAETLIRAAQILDEIPADKMRADDLGRILRALISIGQNDMAAKIAAKDFIASVK